jgi:peptide/nickel transport system substrate-binding protein
MKPWARQLLALVLVSIASTAIAQKSGGILRIPLRENPGSASILEESSIVTNFPFMAVYNNLVLFDQTDKVARPESIKPDLATEWSWSADNTVLTFKLHPNVKWHDGKPFTSADVQCTWDTITGKRDAGWRKNTKKEWYQNLKEVQTVGPLEVKFVLGRPQPSFLTLLATGWSAVYPCHVDGKTMRSKPIGTGPFKVVDYRPGDSLKLTKNKEYFKPGLPYLDGIEYKIIPSSATRVLAFIAGQFDMTFPSDATATVTKDIKAQMPKAICEAVPNNVVQLLLLNHKAPLMQDPRVRRAISLALDRNAFVQAQQGYGRLGGVMMSPPYGVWGLDPQQLEAVPGYGKDVEKNRAEARKLMEEAGYGPTKHLKLPYIVRQSTPAYTQGATLVADQLRTIYIDGDVEPKEYSIFTGMIMKGAYTLAYHNYGVAVDDPDAALYENYTCNSQRNYTKFCDKDIEAKINEQSATLDQKKRKELVQQIDLALQQNIAGPILYHTLSGTCWQPYVKGFVRAVNGIYSHNRMEQVWLDR